MCKLENVKSKINETMLKLPEVPEVNNCITDGIVTTDNVTASMVPYLMGIFFIILKLFFNPLIRLVFSVSVNGNNGVNSNIARKMYV